MIEIEYTYKTRYLGSKVKLLDWMWEVLEPYLKEQKVVSIADLFAGTHSVSYLFKRRGFEVISNDFLTFNSYIGKAIIENQNVILDEQDITMLLNPKESELTFIRENFTDLFFPLEDTKFLDNVFFAISNDITCPHKQALAFAAISHAIIKRAPYGRFTTTKMSDLGKKTIQQYFEEAIIQFNNMVFEGNGSFKTYHEDAIELVKQIKVDAIYLDPPYGGKHYSKYEHYYSFVETYINYWCDEEMIGKLKQVKKRESMFSYGKYHKEAFELLLQQALHIPVWIFSYNNNGGISIEELKETISLHKTNCFLHEVEYEYANKVSSFKEYLIIAY